MKHEFLKDPILYAEQGKNPTVLTKMKSGYAFIGLTQFLPGYCLLIRTPRIGELTDLVFAERSDFLLDNGSPNTIARIPFGLILSRIGQTLNINGTWKCIVT